MSPDLASKLADLKPKLFSIGNPFAAAPIRTLADLDLAKRITEQDLAECNQRLAECADLLSRKAELENDIQTYDDAIRATEREFAFPDLARACRTIHRKEIP